MGCPCVTNNEIGRAGSGDGRGRTTSWGLVGRRAEFAPHQFRAKRHCIEPGLELGAARQFTNAETAIVITLGPVRKQRCSERLA